MSINVKLSLGERTINRLSNIEVPRKAGRLARDQAEFDVLCEAFAEVREACAKIAESGGCGCSFAPCPHDEAGESIACRIRQSRQ